MAANILPMYKQIIFLNIEPPFYFKDMTAYQRVLLKLGTTHPTSHDSKDCQIHVWLGPMEDHVTWLSDHRA